MKKLLKKIDLFVNSSHVQGFITICIVLNSVQLGLDTTKFWQNFAGAWSSRVDNIFIIIFTIEVILKIIGNLNNFFKSSWNIFDFLIVGVSLVPGKGIFSILRIFRFFRSLRLLYRIPRLRIITESLLESIPSIGWIAVLLSIFFYITSIVTTTLFGESFPEWFGSIGNSMYSLFQIMTLESWSMGIVRPVMREYPYAWIVFVPFILIATYTVLNLFIGVIVGAISDAREARESKKEDNQFFQQHNEKINQQILAILKIMQEDIEKLKKEKEKI